MKTRSSRSCDDIKTLYRNSAGIGNNHSTMSNKLGLPLDDSSYDITS